MSLTSLEEDLKTAIAKDVLGSTTVNDPLEELSALRMLHSVDLWDEKGGVGYKKIAKEEKKYLDAAVNLIQSGDPIFSAFGTGLKGAMKLAGILKKRDADRVSLRLIDESLETINNYDKLLHARKTRIATGLNLNPPPANP